MAAETTKGNSPFYPTQPVPPEFFVGRDDQIKRILERGVDQAARGKPISMFIQGEYGIGKTSIAKATQRIAETQSGLLPIYAALGNCNTLNDVAEKVLESTISSGALAPTKAEKIRSIFADYLGSQGLFGININFEALRKDAPSLTGPSQLLAFFSNVIERLGSAGVKGIFLVLDEINGLAGNSKFAHFLKDLVDTNGTRDNPVPLLLVLCGTSEKRWEIIKQHQPTERIFDIVEIDTLSNTEMEEFFTKSFAKEGISVEPDAMNVLVYYSAGFPKIMHLLGDVAFWNDADGKIDFFDMATIMVSAAREFGSKFVENQVFKALQSTDYLAILNKIAKMSLDNNAFQKSDLAKGLSETQKGKLNNFLQRMKKLGVLKSGDVKGEWVFTSRMVRLYIWLKHTKADAAKNKSH